MFVLHTYTYTYIYKYIGGGARVLSWHFFFFCVCFFSGIPAGGRDRKAAPGGHGERFAEPNP